MKSFSYPKITIFMLVLFTAGLSGYSQSDSGTIIKLIKNTHGPTLGYATFSGIAIFTVNGLHFKDLNKNGKLDPYEDWRLPVDVRAKDLAGKMTIEQIAGRCYTALTRPYPLTQMASV